MVKRVYETLSVGEHAVLSVHVLLMRAGQVLLTRRSPDALYAPGLWHAGVAGKVAPGEDIVAAALREAREELGLDLLAADLEFAHLVHSHENQRQAWVHAFFLCRSWSGTPCNREPHKHTEIAWWPAHKPPQGMVGYCAQALGYLLAGEAFSQHRATAYPVSPAPEPRGAQLGDAGLPGSLHRVLSDIADERRRQQTVYGPQRLPSGTGPHHRETAATAQARVDTAGARAEAAWEIIERDDGHINAVCASRYFTPATELSALDREAVERSRQDPRCGRGSRAPRLGPAGLGQGRDRP